MVLFLGTSKCFEAEFMNVNFVEVSGHNLESSQTWGFRILCFHYKLVLHGREGVKSLEVTVNSKEENSSDFCRNYVQEFGLCKVRRVILLNWTPPLPPTRPQYNRVTGASKQITHSLDSSQRKSVTIRVRLSCKSINICFFPVHRPLISLANCQQFSRQTFPSFTWQIFL